MCLLIAEKFFAILARSNVFCVKCILINRHLRSIPLLWNNVEEFLIFRIVVRCICVWLCGEWSFLVWLVLNLLVFGRELFYLVFLWRLFRWLECALLIRLFRMLRCLVLIRVCSFRFVLCVLRKLCRLNIDRNFLGNLMWNCWRICWWSSYSFFL